MIILISFIVLNIERVMSTKFWEMATNYLVWLFLVNDCTYFLGLPDLINKIRSYIKNSECFHFLIIFLIN